MLNESTPGMTFTASPKLITHSGRQGSVGLTQDGSDVAMTFDLLPELTENGAVELNLKFGTAPVALPRSAKGP